MRYVERPLVYVAGPYTKPDPVENVNATVRIATRLCDEGLVTPFIPHLTALWHFIEPRPLDFWYEYDLAALARCDAVLRLPGESTGADKEVSYAQESNVPVFVVEDSMEIGDTDAVLESQGIRMLHSWAREQGTRRSDA